MNIIQLAVSIEKMRRDIEAPWVQNTIAHAVTAVDTLVKNMGGADSIRRMMEEQERMVREFAGHRRACEQLAQLAAEQAAIDSSRRDAFDVPYISPRLEHRCRGFRREIQVDEEVPKRTIARREVRRRIGFI